MTDRAGYAVFFFEQAIEILGDAIQPYLSESPAGQCLHCLHVDTGGALVQCTLDARATTGQDGEMQLMFPVSMVRLIASARIEDGFGFGPRRREPEETGLPVLGPTATPARAPSESLPDTVDEARSGAAAQLDSHLPPEG